MESLNNLINNLTDLVSNPVFIVGVIAIILLCWFISVNNKIERFRIKFNESSSTIDIALINRSATLTKMFDLATSYAAKETESISKIISVKNGMNSTEKNLAVAEMNQMQKGLYCVAESYPELASNKMFQQLSSTLVDIENNLMATRRLHNSNVSIYNQAITQFPNSIVAAFKGYKSEAYFTATAEEKKDVSMKF